jgi:hypothetical protein
MNLEDIERLEDALRLAMLDSDVGQLEELLSPELSFTTFLGTMIDKSADLQAHQSGLLTFHAIDISERELRQLDTHWAVTCLAWIDATFDDDRSKKAFRFTRVWAPTGPQGAQVVTGQATLVLSSLDEG